MRYRDIAVIGMSGRFASANNRREFRELLRNKKSTIQEPPKERLDLMKLTEGEYAKAGYLINIEEFDNEFFDIPKREAKLMSPEQRISLELVAETILDAGYSLEEFRGSDCGVFVAGQDSVYERFTGRQTSASILGSQSFMNSGRIGYQFDLRGENAVIQTGCSSALMALHNACEKISFGEMETAIVGGVKLYIDGLKAKDNFYDNVGIISKNYELHTFDEKANGTVCGEGGGYVLLKSLEAARRDGDHIYGVFLSGAVSGDGGRSTSVSMPSKEAQTEAVLKAWKDIDTEHITELESHGIGSQIGDVTEIQAFVDAVKKKEMVENHIRVSALKPNTGYLMEVAGIASLLKVLTGYQYQETYPVAGLEHVNPEIPFDEGGLIPAREVYHWSEEQERMTGISAFTLSGCNVHMVVKNYNNNTASHDFPTLLKLSARTENAFHRMRKEILNYLSEGNMALGDVIYTLNKGRDDYQFRRFISFDSLVGLKNQLEELEPVKIGNAKYKVIYALGMEQKESVPYQKYEKILPGFRHQKSVRTGDKELDAKVSMYQYLQQLGIHGDTVLADGICQKAIQYAEGVCTKEEWETFRKLADSKNVYEDYIAQFHNSNESNKRLLIDFSFDHSLEALNGIKNIQVINVHDSKQIQELLVFWYESGKKIDWKTYYQGCDYQKVPAPAYSFERTSFWVEIERKQDTVEKKQAETVETSVVLPEKKVFLMKSEDIGSVDVFQYPYSNPEYRKVFEPETGDIDVDYKLAMYRYLTESGVVPDVLIADKKALGIVDFARGRLSKKRLLEKLKIVNDTDYTKAYDEIEKLAKDYYVRVYDFTHGDAFTNYQWKGTVQVFPLIDEKTNGHFFDTKQYVKAVKQEVVQEKEPEVELAAQELPVSEKEKSGNGSKSQQLIDAENFLETTWAKAFNLDGEIGHDEDFFSLGGNSIIMAAMSDTINEHFKIKFDIFEIFDYETIEKLAVKIVEEL